MALLWVLQTENIRYEVRTAGNTVRLYTNGVFHSQYNGSREFLGGIWDLLYLPVFHTPDAASVLLLGVGGGAVIHPLLRHFPVTRLDGVDIDAVHLDVARQYFDIRYPEVHLHHASAWDWLSGNTGKRWDVVIEDVYTHLAGEPVRGMPLEEEWLTLLWQSTSDAGMLIINFTEPAQMRSALKTFRRCISGKFYACQLRTGGYTNLVLCLSRTPLNARMLRSEIPQRFRSLGFSVSGA